MLMPAHFINIGILKFASELYSELKSVDLHSNSDLENSAISFEDRKASGPCSEFHPLLWHCWLGDTDRKGIRPA